MNNKQKTKNKKPLKLCFIGDARSIHTQRWANGFVDIGHEVYLLDVNEHKYKNLKFKLIKNKSKFKPLNFILKILQYRKIIKDIKPDLLHSHQISYHGLMGALSNFHPFISSPWGSDINSDPEKSFFHKLIPKFVFKKSDIIQCMDKSFATRVLQLSQSSKNKIFLINEGIKTSFYKKTKARKKSKNSQINILFLRKLLPRTYHADVLIESMNIVVNKMKIKNIKVQMLKSGEPDYVKKIFNMVKRYNLEKYIIFHDWLDRKGLLNLFNTSDIYIDTFYRDIPGSGIGKTALQAMSCELAVIIPNNPGVELFFEHNKNALIYEGGNPESLANSIKKMIKNKRLITKFGKISRNFVVENTDWDKNIKKIEKKYYYLANKS